MKTSAAAFLLLPAFLLGQTMLGHAVTGDITTPNIFSGAAADASTTHSGGWSAAAIDDGGGIGATQQFVFDDGPQAGSPQLLNISGFDASSGINSITFYDSATGQRAAPSVIIYTSTSILTNNLNPADYTALNGGLAFTLPTDAGVPPSSYIEGADTSGSGRGFDTLSDLNIPVGTQSILFDFGTGTGEGYGLAEIQGFAAIPEPGTWALLLGGVGLLALVYRRRGVLLS
jgi:hypothetical protein